MDGGNSSGLHRSARDFGKEELLCLHSWATFELDLTSPAGLNECMSRRRVIRICASVNSVVLGELGGRGVERRNDASQPIGHTESCMQLHLAYVGKMVANIHTIPARMKDEYSGPLAPGIGSSQWKIDSGQTKHVER